MEAKVSVHMIVKEVSFYGYLLLKSSLDSLLMDNSGYADELIIYNDGCDQTSTSFLEKIVKNCGIKCVYSKNIGEDLTFAEKRNVCLDNTGHDITHIHWIDSDDIYYEDTLIAVKKKLGEMEDCGVFINNFHHCMGYPWRIAGTYPKDNIFRYNPKLKWGKGVHETLENVEPVSQSPLGLPYFHAGYTRSVIATAIKWIYYSVLEHGADNCCYFRENEAMFTDGPHKIISDRIANTSKITFEEMPSAFVENVMMSYKGLIEYEKWDDWVTRCIDPKYGNLFKKFKVIANAEGNWGAFVKEVIDNKLWKEF